MRSLVLALFVALPAIALGQDHAAPNVYYQFSDMEEVTPPSAPRTYWVSQHGEGELMALPTPAESHPYDPSLVARGQTLFTEHCTDCHEAEKATDERKSYANWLKTVDEMARQEDAEIPRDVFVPIATYLAALGPPNPQADGEAMEAEDDEEDEREPRFDPGEVARGQSAFQSSCLQCHDAQRSLSKRKSLGGWLATVRRMARLDDANVNSSDIRPIAVYLASLNASGEGDDGSEYDEAVSEALGESVNLSGTISTLWRGGNDNLETPNFFADAWIRMDWQPEGPLRARVTTCTSCHSDQTNGGGFTLELVEATASLDLLHSLRGPETESGCPRVEAELKAGRFVVPFGAFASMSHPGVYRTVTNPLMFNMGRQVNASGSRPPVLPMPYSDEGVDLHASIPWCRDWKITLDGYAVNGLQGRGGGVNYTSSRDYADNNRHAGYGGRATIGNPTMRLGSSVMAGRMEDEGSDPLNYHLAGADATARFCDDDVRLYFEYAIRRNDTIFGQRQISYGIVSELEVLLCERPNLSFLARYDTLEHRDFFGESSVERFTWGFSTTLAGSLLIINHEYWNFPTDEFEDVDVLGVRWVATF